MSAVEEKAPATATQQPAVALALVVSMFAVLGLGIFPSRWLAVFMEMARSFI
ncbi:MAG: hypothetical protein Q9P14_18790 [candidate division KSB1 bacterium]|nr:hypothetical protein [candidate division KSB1 bacterium]